MLAVFVVVIVIASSFIWAPKIASNKVGLSIRTEQPESPLTLLVHNCVEEVNDGGKKHTCEREAGWER